MVNVLAAAVSKISRARLWNDHQCLAEFGKLSNGGVNRQALSEQEWEARTVLIQWGDDFGLSAATDEMGNFFLRLEGSEPSLPPVVIGSHIDSQPTGGKFDGAFGVLASLEVLRAIRETGVLPRRSIELVAWMNEEGSRFAPGMMGSAAFCGARDIEKILAVRDANNISVADELEIMRKRFPLLPVRKLGFPIHAYIEPHIEQGPVLERKLHKIGVVTGIQGKQTFRVDVKGEEAHAGTTPRAARKDALIAAISLVSKLDKITRDQKDVTRFTVGRFTVQPNAPSVVPAQVSFSIDLRHPNSKILDHLGTEILKVCSNHSSPCHVECEMLVNDPPVVFSKILQEQIASAAKQLNLNAMSILSAAGHDAKFLARVCPTGMIFVPCKDGVSHSEAESAEQDDLYAGAQVLCQVACHQAGA